MWGRGHGKEGAGGHVWGKEAEGHGAWGTRGCMWGKQRLGWAAGGWGHGEAKGCKGHGKKARARGQMGRMRQNGGKVRQEGRWSGSKGGIWGRGHGQVAGGRELVGKVTGGSVAVKGTGVGGGDKWAGEHRAGGVRGSTGAERLVRRPRWLVPVPVGHEQQNGISENFKKHMFGAARGRGR